MTYPNNANQYLPNVIQIPSALEITAITQASPAVVTVSANPIIQADTYIPGQLVRMNLPYGYGMQQLAGMTVLIIAVSPTTLTLYVNTTNYDPFIIPSSGIKPASLSPAGSQNLSYSNSTNQIGFQSLNNIGN